MLQYAGQIFLPMTFSPRQETAYISQQRNTFPRNCIIDRLTLVPNMFSGSNSSSPGPWPDLKMTFGGWTIFICGVVAFWIVLSCFLAYFLGPDFVTCYLCEKQVRLEWRFAWFHFSRKRGTHFMRGGAEKVRKCSWLLTPTLHYFTFVKYLAVLDKFRIWSCTYCTFIDFSNGKISNLFIILEKLGVGWLHRF